MNGFNLQNTSGLPTSQCIKINRLGASTKIGGAYMLDVAQADAASTTLELGYTNLLMPTTAGIKNRPFVVATEVQVNAAFTRVIEGETFRCQVLCDGSGSAIAKGDPLKLVNASETLVKATAGADRYHATALQACTLAATLVEVEFYSRGRF